MTVPVVLTLHQLNLLWVPAERQGESAARLDITMRPWQEALGSTSGAMGRGEFRELPGCSRYANGV